MSIKSNLGKLREAAKKSDSRGMEMRLTALLSNSLRKIVGEGAEITLIITGASEERGQEKGLFRALLKIDDKTPEEFIKDRLGEGMSVQAFISEMNKALKTIKDNDYWWVEDQYADKGPETFKIGAFEIVQSSLPRKTETYRGERHMSIKESMKKIKEVLREAQIGDLFPSVAEVEAELKRQLGPTATFGDFKATLEKASAPFMAAQAIRQEKIDYSLANVKLPAWAKPYLIEGSVMSVERSDEETSYMTVDTYLRNGEESEWIKKLGGGNGASYEKTMDDMIDPKFLKKDPFKSRVDSINKWRKKALAAIKPLTVDNPFTEVVNEFLKQWKDTVIQNSNWSGDPGLDVEIRGKDIHLSAATIDALSGTELTLHSDGTVSGDGGKYGFADYLGGARGSIEKETISPEDVGVALLDFISDWVSDSGLGDDSVIKAGPPPSFNK